MYFRKEYRLQHAVSTNGLAPSFQIEQPFIPVGCYVVAKSDLNTAVSSGNLNDKDLSRVLYRQLSVDITFQNLVFVDLSAYVLQPTVYSTSTTFDSLNYIMVFLYLVKI